MYQVEIQNEIVKTKNVLILPGQVIPNEDGSDSQSTNDTDQNIEKTIQRSAAEILVEEQAIKDLKEAEVQDKVDAYEAAIQNQLENGGPGPVADFETMKIVNEHNGEFEIVFKEEE